MRRHITRLAFDAPRGLASRVRLLFYRAFGLRLGRSNRIEGLGRVRHCNQIVIGSFNAFSQGCWLWPTPDPDDPRTPRIAIGNGNYFNRNLMIDACGQVTIGDDNMFGPDVYITDSDHTFGPGISPKSAPMRRGRVRASHRVRCHCRPGCRRARGCQTAKWIPV